MTSFSERLLDELRAADGRRRRPVVARLPRRGPVLALTAAIAAIVVVVALVATLGGGSGTQTAAPTPAAPAGLVLPRVGAV